MKKFLLLLVQSIVAIFASTPSVKLPIGEPWPNSVMEGDVNSLENDVMGDANLEGEAPDSNGDFEGDFEGETLGGIFKKLRKRGIKKTSKRVKNSTGNQQTTAANSIAATSAVSAVPGAALAATDVRPVMITNGKVTTPGTALLAKGYAVKSVLDRWIPRAVRPTYTLSAVCTTDPTIVEFTEAYMDAIFGTVQGTVIKIFAPCIYITISGSVLQTAPGAPMTITVGGWGEDGINALTADQWAFKRETIDRPSELVVYPYIRTMDRLLPQMFYIELLCGASTWTVTKGLTVNVTGLSAGQSVSVTIPGINSKELLDFLATFGMQPF